MLDAHGDLDRVTREWVQERLADLSAADPMNEKEQRRMWQEIKDHAPAIFTHPTTRKVIDTLVTEAVKRSL